MALLSILAVLANASSAPVTPPPPVVCPGMLRPALELIVKNERGQVLSQFGWPVTEAAWLKVTKIGERYTVTINRRWYQPQTIPNIKVMRDDCGPAKPTRVVARLQPVPGAPVIREFRIVNVNSDNLMVVGYWPYFQRYTTFLDAPGSVSRKVVWTSSRPDVATIDQSGMLRSVCNREPGRTTITATLKVDPTQVSSTVFGRGGGGMMCPRGAVDR
ncbi:Ig-like domain-containing protein [Deinococcus sp. HMF7604]|uniref:Ig-like domain-containing protein n=1 Tax=Deinococcus betulae TaxID=2873312 RepID=UPI001CCA7ABA|nr:Ig-like domain-containing protein [Deinococcus betulae]MBZ9751707.1 Ig-like domain-containing protein [Deinococcus betulae]